MPETLQAARAWAENVRFADDHSRAGLTAPATTMGIRRRLAQDGLQISSMVTPALQDVLERTERELHLPSGMLTAFVEASPVIQASCHLDGAGHCTIVLASALVELLDANELAFVVGHELGHFLLGHGIAEMAASDGQIEMFMRMRAQEVSADRIGLLACGELDVALRALMKTLSGLSAKHVRFDVGAFLSQLRAPGVGPTAQHMLSTHPSILVRCRALMWYASSASGPRPIDTTEDSRGQIDERIRKDLRRFTDGPAMQRLRDLESDLALWMAAEKIAEDGVFDRDEQANLADEFGEDTLRSLKGFLSTHTASAARAAIADRVDEARQRLQRAAPEGFGDAVDRIAARIGHSFGPRGAEPG